MNHALGRELLARWLKYGCENENEIEEYVR